MVAWVISGKMEGSSYFKKINLLNAKVTII